MEKVSALCQVGIRPRGDVGTVKRVATKTHRCLPKRRRGIAPWRGKHWRLVVRGQCSPIPRVVTHGQQYLKGLPDVMEDSAAQRSVERSPKVPDCVARNATKPVQQIVRCVNASRTQPRREPLEGGERQPATPEARREMRVKMRWCAKPVCAVGCVL